MALDMDHNIPLTDSAPLPEALDELRLEKFFNGKALAYGFFEDRFGKVRTQFRAEFTGHYDGETLTLVEEFLYDNGSTETRNWSIRPEGDTRYIADASGIDEQIIGTVDGKTFHWAYKMGLPIMGKSRLCDFDDYMYLQPDNVILNRVRVSWKGIRIGQVIISLRKL